MGRIILFILLISSFVSFGQTFNMKSSRAGDTVQKIIQTTKSGGIVKYLLITGTDTAEIRWDGTNLLIDTTLEVRGRIWQSGMGNSIILGDSAGWNDDLLGNNLNVVIGNSAFFYNTIGVGNVIAGANAGKYYGSGTDQLIVALNSVLIGNNIRSSADVSTNEIGIGANVITNGDHTATIGDDNITDVWMNEDGTATLQVGRVVTNGLGNSVFMGKDAGLNDDLTNNNNVLIGTDAGKTLTTSDYNVAIGYKALELCITGGYNVAVGSNALNKTTSHSNTAVGTLSMYNNVTGAENTAIGSEVLYNNIGGSYNTSIGRNSLYSNTEGIANTAVGTGALYANIDGDNNTGIGDNAFAGLTGGDNSVGVGYQAGRHYGVGSNALLTAPSSIFIGYDTRANADGETNQIVIGANAIGKGTNQAVILDDNGTDVWMNENGTAIVHAGEYMLGTDYKIIIFNDTMCGVKISTTDTVRIVPTR